MKAKSPPLSSAGAPAGQQDQQVEDADEQSPSKLFRNRRTQLDSAALPPAPAIADHDPERR